MNWKKFYIIKKKDCKTKIDLRKRAVKLNFYVNCQYISNYLWREKCFPS